MLVYGRYIGFIVLWQAGGVGGCCEDVTLVSIVVGGQTGECDPQCSTVSALVTFRQKYAVLLIKIL